MTKIDFIKMTLILMPCKIVDKNMSPYFHVITLKWSWK